MPLDAGNFNRLETDHPLEVSVKAGELSGCFKDDKCRLWGAGILRCVNNRVDDYSGQVILSAAGCETCSLPTVTHGDLGVIGSLTDISQGSRDTVIDDMRVEAKIKLAQTVQAFVPKRSETPYSP